MEQQLRRGGVPPPVGLRFERHVLVNRLRIQGFILFDYRDKYEDALSRIYMIGISKGMLNYREDIAEGLRKCTPSSYVIYIRDLIQGRQLIRVTRRSHNLIILILFKISLINFKLDFL